MSQTKAQLIDGKVATVEFSGGSASAPSIAFSGDTNTGIYSPGADTLAFVEGGTEVIRITSAGNVGIGTTSPSQLLHVNNGNILLSTGYNTYFGSTSNLIGGDSGLGRIDIAAGGGSANTIVISTAGSERARIDSSGRLLVGTSTARANFFGISARVQSEAAADQTGRNTALIYGRSIADGPLLTFAKHRSDSVGGQTILQSGDICGEIVFTGSDGANFQAAALIKAEVDGTPGTNDMPGRLVFSTTADGANIPTERMRITQTGGVRLPDVYNATIALSANVFIDTDGTLKRATSSIKYKTNVETLEDQYADAVLNCRPVWYKSTSGGDNPEWGYWGFIAEEVAEIDPRLVQWKLVEQVINEDGSRETVPLEAPEPENVAYDRFVPHLLNLIKRQKEQIEAMEARLSALEAQ